MGSLPSQKQLIKAIVRTSGELSGLQANVLRLFTDTGTGVEVNRSLGRRTLTGESGAAVAAKESVWELDRIFPDDGTVSLEGLIDDGTGKTLGFDKCYLSAVDGTGKKVVEVHGAAASPTIGLPAAGGSSGLVTLRVVAPDPPPSALWEGTLRFTPNSPGGATVRHPVMIWTDLP